MKTEKDSIKEYVERIQSPIFDEVLQETSKNHMLVSPLKNQYINFCLYNPHNYRLYFKYERSSISKNRGLGYFSDASVGKSKNNSKRKIRGLGYFSYRKINHNKEELFNFDNYVFRIKKTQIEVKNKNNRWFRVPVIIDCDKYFKEIIINLEKEMLKALKTFIYFYGGVSDYQILNRSSENKIKNEDFIDSIPFKSKWDNDISKKVYVNDSAVEFKEAIFASNYITNQSINDNISILEDIRDLIGSINPLNFLKLRVKCIDDVMKFKDYVKLLSNEEKKDFEDWLFLELSIHP